MPLQRLLADSLSNNKEATQAYDTAYRPPAPPQPISIIEKVILEITKLSPWSARWTMKSLYCHETLPNEAQGRRIGEAPYAIPSMGHLGREV